MATPEGIFNKYKFETTTHEDVVRANAERILSQPIPWEGYRRAELIKDPELELIKKYDKKNEEVRKGLMKKVRENNL